MCVFVCVRERKSQSAKTSKGFKQIGTTTHRVNLVHGGRGEGEAAAAVTSVVGPLADVPLHETVAVHDEGDPAPAEVLLGVVVLAVCVCRKRWRNV